MNCETFQEHLKARLDELLPPGAGIVAALSGGPDSVAMAHALAVLQDAGRLGRALELAHLNHCTRGADSDADQAYVERLARSWGCACRVGTEDVPALARSRKRSLEEAARDARYGFLARAAREAGAGAVLTAHTLDDQVETVLMRIIRGTGLGALGGMRALRPLGPGHGEIMLARPLLALSRSAVLAYCAGAGLEPRTDATNEDTRFTRNWVRWKLLPLLAEANPQIRRSVLRLAELARAADELIESQADQAFLPAIASTRPGRVDFRIEALSDRNPAVAFTILRRAVEQLSEGGLSLGSNAFWRLRELMRGAEDRLAPLASGWRARREGPHLVIERPDQRAPPASWEVLLEAPGRTVLPTGGAIEVVADEATPAGARVLMRAKPRTVEYADADAVEDAQAVVRTRREGDRFKAIGATGGRSLKKFLIDAKIPAPARAELPLVARREQILWVCGQRLSDAWKITRATLRVAKLTYEGP